MPQLSEKNQATLTIPSFKIKQALVGLELSATDESILEYLKVLAEAVQVDAITFLHVVPDFQSFIPFPEEHLPKLVPQYEIGEELIQRMEEQVKRTFPEDAGIYFDYAVKEGNALEEVLSSAASIQPDLVVIGQKAGPHYHNIRARKLIRELRYPALVIPEDSQYRLRDFLVPIDFSEDSIAAFQQALKMASQIDGPTSVHVLHVYEVPNLNVYKIQKTREEFEAMLRENREVALQTFLDTYARDTGDVQVSTALLERLSGSTAQMIKEYALEYGADMLLIGAKGHSRVELVLLGSITEHLLDLNESIPTMIVKK